MWNSEPPVSSSRKQIVRISYIFCLSPLNHSFCIVKLAPFQLLTRRDVKNNQREWMKLSFGKHSGSTLPGRHVSFCVIFMKKPTYCCAGSNVRDFWPCLTVNFFKVFWNLLCQQRTDSLNPSFEHDELPNSQKQPVYSMNWEYIKDWRPISHLNVDVRIAKKALAWYVKSRFNIPLGTSALWWLTASSSFCSFRFFKYKPRKETIIFLLCFAINTTCFH